MDCLYGPSLDRSRKLVKSLHLIDSGSVHSGRMITYLENLTGLQNLKEVTLAELTGVRGVAALCTRPYRKWCPHCYSDDVAKGLPPYDRLLWSINLVRFCPVHEVALHSICLHCGGDRAPQLFGRDVSGFCPRCFGWLGEPASTRQLSADDQTKHLRWIARSFSDLLEGPPLKSEDLLPLIQSAIRKLGDLHHGGATTYLAREIRRNKSVVSTWLGGGSRPAWDALCDVSYVYQQPLRALLEGMVSEITVSEPLPLPSSALPRQGQRRKRPVVRDPVMIVTLLEQVAAGLHPGVTAVQQVADRLNMNVRELYRLAPDAAKAAVVAIAKRSSAQRVQAAAYRLTEREAAIVRVGQALASRKSKVTRRIVHEEMARNGIAVRWTESREVLSSVRRAIAAAEATAPATEGVSGTS